ncbi:UNVERIFIED_ORG: hypothetical protein FHW05_004710 [Pantoea agglomerans]
MIYKVLKHVSFAMIELIRTYPFSHFYILINNYFMNNDYCWLLFLQVAMSFNNFIQSMQNMAVIYYCV